MKLDEILNTVILNSPSAFFFTPPFYRNSKSYLFTNPVKVISVKDSEEFNEKLEEVQQMIHRGFSGYAAISYETAYFLEPRMNCLGLPMNNECPFMQFYLFRTEDITNFNSAEIDYSKNSSNNDRYNISEFCLNVSKREYVRDIKKIKQYIAEGDTYQVNYTIKGRFNFSGSIANLFLSGIYNQSARYCALINNDDKFIVSFSPELFFSSKNRKLQTMPMKGTIKRGINLDKDNLKLNELRKSCKDNSENLMIVDLLRNDMGRISKYGSVSVDKIFHIEKYETLYQMVSLISSVMNDQVHLTDIIKNLFPGGSISGAPKIRTMEIIHELEKEPRGVYTGAIGMFDKHKSVFNLPIRTIIVDKSTSQGEIGIGSGIVWDSDPEKEYEETLLKSNFLLKAESEFEIFETMLVENGSIFLINLHLKRMEAAATYFLFRFNRKKVNEKLSSICREANPTLKYRLKLFLNKWGMLRTEMTTLNESITKFKVIISDTRIESQCKYYYFKTTHRELYTKELELYKENGFNEVLFLNEKNELCEGSFTNIFVKKNNIWYTPPVQCGLLNGTFRQFLLRNKKLYTEKIIYPEDLRSADDIILVNSLRKKISIENVCWKGQTIYK